ncbi:MAG: NAD(P)/FAD-dependent oxidoreductase, partial [Deltaproteobacteria bacterium]|nr:NAD(P)/FAD-dependent oxidoreductase [Deltaproteobacteria bacterium]
LTRKSLDILPFDIRHVIEDYVYASNIFVRNRPVYIKTASQPIISMVMRDRFDYYLAEKAVRAGALLHDEVTFKSLSGPVGNLKIETDRGVFRSKIIVGADGVNSRVARSLGLYARHPLMNTIEAEVYPTSPKIFETFKGTAHFSLGFIPYGYGWIFPKRAHLSVGLLSTSLKDKDLKSYLTSYLKIKDLFHHVEVRSVSRHLIPCRVSRGTRFSNTRGLVLGDAAGVADPITGEGIFYAIRGAQLASNVIRRALNAGYPYLEDYNPIMNRELIRDLAYARRMAFMLYRMPFLSLKLLDTHGEKAAEHYLAIVSGEKTYAQLQKKLFGLKLFH